MSKVIVYHGMRGCESGCCGHWVQVEGERPAFTFSHPDVSQTDLEYARMAVSATFSSEHVADLDWENCVIVDD